MDAPLPRRALAGDAAALAVLAERAYAAYVPRIGLRPAPMDANYGHAVAHDEVWVVDGDADGLAGVLVLQQRADHLMIDNVAVDPAYQGRGIGRDLLDLAERRADELGLPAIELFTHSLMTENQQIYERRGYRRTAQVDEEGFNRFYYRKDLT
jgi:ribosomal protein S18 acetylase RimI-like enzyme